MLSSVLIDDGHFPSNTKRFRCDFYARSCLPSLILSISNSSPFYKASNLNPEVLLNDVEGDVGNGPCYVWRLEYPFDEAV